MPGFGGYRSLLKGLYLFVAGRHPGGCVMVPRHNAAHAVIEDEFDSSGLAECPSDMDLRRVVERMMANTTVRKLGSRAAGNPAWPRSSTDFLPGDPLPPDSSSGKVTTCPSWQSRP